MLTGINVSLSHRSLFGAKVQSRRLLAELLLQTSQIRPADRVVIVAATNRIGEFRLSLHYHRTVYYNRRGMFYPQSLLGHRLYVTKVRCIVMMSILVKIVCQHTSKKQSK